MKPRLTKTVKVNVPLGWSPVRGIADCNDSTNTGVDGGLRVSLSITSILTYISGESVQVVETLSNAQLSLHLNNSKRKDKKHGDWKLIDAGFRERR